METIKQKLEALGQAQLLTFFDQLEEGQKGELVEDLTSVDWDRLQDIYNNEVLPQLDKDGSTLKPVAKIDDSLLQELPSSCLEGTTRCTSDKLKHYQSVGSENIREGKVAALLLAGGQGTRLGVDYPKGMYDVGLPGNKCLFQLQAERILKLSQANGDARIMWYIMTSDATMARTRKFFEAKNYFGLTKEDVIFFEQGTMPCFGFNGRVLLDQKHRIAKSPDGNGGLYGALHRQGIIHHMEKNGVEFVHVFCVDNILVRVCDPIFVGYCISKGADAGAKVVEKILPNEAVGTICKVGDQFKVIEYSEISDRIASKRNEQTGKLAFNAGNICDHFFRVEYLKTITDDSKKLMYHLAIKKIPHIDFTTGERDDKPYKVCGIKLEKFVFDVFEFTDRFVAWEVKREDEFSPLKNADGTEKDNPTTARMALSRAYELGILEV